VGSFYSSLQGQLERNVNASSIKKPPAIASYFGTIRGWEGDEFTWKNTTFPSPGKKTYGYMMLFREKTSTLLKVWLHMTTHNTAVTAVLSGKTG
jgi:hypothetical protein